MLAGTVTHMSHPTLYFTQSDVPELREKVRSGVAAWLFEQLRERCRTHVETIDLTRDTWDRVTGIVHAHSIVRPLVELSLTGFIAEEVRFLDLAGAILRRISRWDTWFADYEPTRPVTAAHRHIVFIRPDNMFVVVDDIRSETPIRVPELLIHTDENHPVVRQTSPHELLMPGAAADLRLIFAQPTGAGENRGHSQTTGVMYAEHTMHRTVTDEMDKENSTWFSVLPAARREGDEQNRVLFVTLFDPVRHDTDHETVEIADSDTYGGFRIAGLALVESAASGTCCLAASFRRLHLPEGLRVEAGIPIFAAVTPGRIHLSVEAECEALIAMPGLTGVGLGADAGLVPAESQRVSLTLGISKHDVILETVKT